MRVGVEVRDGAEDVVVGRLPKELVERVGVLGRDGLDEGRENPPLLEGREKPPPPLDGRELPPELGRPL
jgi:hypothetical protein